jgi:hypothetical protein
MRVQITYLVRNPTATSSLRARRGGAPLLLATLRVCVYVLRTNFQGCPDELRFLFSFLLSLYAFVIC